MSDVPLIWTSKGNLPIESLKRSDGWEFTNTNITYWEQYELDGEIVKRGVAIYALPNGTEFNLLQGQVNG